MSFMSGGKANGLKMITDLGIAVPEYLVIHESVNGKALDSLVKTVPDQIGPGPYAVRSSANVEDSLDASFAGLFESELGVNKEALSEAVESVRQSTHADRVKSYAAEKGLTNSIEMAVIVQTLVEADVSGVALSIAPTAKRSEILVETVRGLGESLVGGLVEPDQFRIPREDREFVERTKGGQRYMITAGGWSKLDSGEIARGELHLVDGHLMEVTGALGKLEHAMSGPVDLEFCFKDNKFYALQARPQAATSAKNRFERN